MATNLQDWPEGQRSPLLLLLRRVVAATAVPPLSHAYRLVYDAVIRIMVRVLRRYPEVKAIYLRQGYASGELVPGVSDIDLGVVASSEDELGADFARAYSQAARWLVLPERGVEVYPEEGLERLPHQSYFYACRVIEGQGTWKLLYGRDFIRELDRVTPSQALGASYFFLGATWACFGNWVLFGEGANHQDPIFVRNICCKAVTGCLKAELVFRCGHYPMSRGETLRLAEREFPEIAGDWPERIRSIVASRYLRGDAELPDQVLGSLLKYFDHFARSLHGHAFTEPVYSGALRVECDPHELPGWSEDRTAVEALFRELQAEWAELAQAVYLVPSLWFGVDQRLVFLELKPHRRPTMEQMRRLPKVLARAQERAHSPLVLYLLTGSSALHLGPVRLHRSSHRQLHPLCQPEVFALISRDEFRVAGEGRPPAAPDFITEPVLQFLRELRANCQADLQRCGEDEALALKLQQLDLLEGSLESGRPRFALTPAAIRRAWAEQGELAGVGGR